MEAAAVPRVLRRFLQANYPEELSSQAADRYGALVQRFQELFPGSPMSLARAPGRINLIGEHTDYNGLPVFPFAIHRDLAAAFGPRSDRRVVLHNLDPAYAPREFRLDSPIPPYATGDWGNYPKAAAQGLLERFPERGVEARGVNAVIHGDIPPAAGLSSSSAMVVLAALMLLETWGSPLPGPELAALLARAEQYVGTQGGGMDQAVSLLSRSGMALKIDFFPLRVTPAPLPLGYVFVVADTLVKAAKTAEALDKYNRRPIECRLAVAVLRRRLAERLGRPVAAERLGDLVDPATGLGPSQLLSEVRQVLHPAPYSLEEIARILGSRPPETARDYCLRRDGSVFPQPADGFKLRERCLHVLEEGRRVEDFLDALQTGEVPRLGDLMDRSHESCRDLYEISCPELDRLTEIAREAGAEGSRLTGAGFGGCTVSLVREKRLPEFLAAVTRRYYREHLRGGPPDLSSALFACRAVDGAGVLS